MTIEHRAGDAATRHGSFFLTESESSRLWSLIDKAGLASVQSSSGPQTIAAEVRHVFTLTSGGTSHKTALSTNDISDHQTFDRLRAQVTQLIAVYVGITPGA